MGRKSDRVFESACAAAGVNPVVAIGHQEYPEFDAEKAGAQKKVAAATQESELGRSGSEE